jgi:DNA polymerase III alpha subunit
MKLVQLRLDTFFSINTTQSVSKKEGKLFDISAGAKTLLEPLFVRSVPDDTRYTEQLAEEYELIDKNQFAPVFLQVRKVLEIIAGMNKPPPHIIRGSAGSSLVTYLLGITHVDPIINRIELARFMNTLRKDMPDIDIDVPYNRREEIYGLIGKAYPGQVGCCRR